MGSQISRRRILKAGASVGLVAIGGSLQSCTGKSESTELVVWQTETDPNAILILERVKTEFEQAHAGVVVKIESVPWGTLATKLSTAIQNGAPPDISHLEPFMTYSFVRRGLLSPISDLVSELDGPQPGRIFDAVKTLQRFDGEYYGLAYAVGVTAWTYDTRKLRGVPFPYPSDTAGTITTEQFISFAKSVKEKGGSGLVLLPGGSPFFLDQLVGELVANAGGRLYDPNTSRWQFEGAEVRRVFEFLLSLKTEGLLDPNWAGQTYPDQFPRLAKIDGPLVTPVTYARAAVAIRKLLSDDDGGSRASDATGDVFRFMSQPVFPGAPVSGSVATIDCEPYVIFAGPAQQKFAGKPRRELSIDFLRRFYKDSNYLDFTKSVPIHLTPIFRDLAKNPEYLATIGKWSNWHAHTMRFLETPGRTRPILVPGSSPESLEADLKNPYLLDLQAQNVISNAVAEMLTANQNPDLTKILRGVQDRATSLSSGR